MSPSHTSRSIEIEHPEIFRRKSKVSLESINRFVLLAFAFSPIISIVTWVSIQISGKFLFATIMIVLTFMNMLNPRKKGSGLKNYYFILALLIAYHLILDIVYGRISFDRIQLFAYKNWAVQTLCVLYLIDNTKFKTKKIHLYVRFMVIVAIMAVVVSFIQIRFDKNFLIQKYYYEGQSNYSLVSAQSIYSYIDRNAIGFDFVPMMAALIGWSVFFGRQNLYLINVLIAGFVSMASTRRYVMLAVVVALFQFVFIKMHAKKKTLWLIGVVFGVSIVIMLFSFVFSGSGYSLDNYLHKRILSESAMSRIEAFSLFKKHFPRNIWLGTGGGQDFELKTDIRSGYTSQIHVGYLSFLYQYGIFGGVLFFMFIITFLVKLIRESSYSKFYGGLFAFIVILVNYATLVQFSLLYTGVAFGLILHKFFYEQKKLEDEQARLLSVEVVE